MCRWLGVEHIYLTENANQTQQQMSEQLHDFIDEGFLTYNHDDTPGGQMKVVSDCIRQHYLEYDWLSFLDVDEFLVLRNKCASSWCHPGLCCNSVFISFLVTKAFSKHESLHTSSKLKPIFTSSPAIQPT